MGVRASTRNELICLQKFDLRIYVVSNPGQTGARVPAETSSRDSTRRPPAAPNEGTIQEARLPVLDEQEAGDERQVPPESLAFLTPAAAASVCSAHWFIEQLARAAATAMAWCASGRVLTVIFPEYDLSGFTPRASHAWR